MTMLELQEKVKELEISLVRLDETAILDIVEAAEPGTDPDQAETAHWFYSVPFPGVRYYQHEELLL